MIDLAPEHLEFISKEIKKTFPDSELRVFGSRVRGTASRYSDLDIAIVNITAIDWKDLEKLKSSISESDIPILVDIHDWQSISEEFRKIIEEKYVVL